MNVAKYGPPIYKDDLFVYAEGKIPFCKAKGFFPLHEIGFHGIITLYILGADIWVASAGMFFMCQIFLSTQYFFQMGNILRS